MTVVYIIISYILYWDSLLPLLIATAADCMCLIAGIVVASVVGKPVSYLSCSSFPAQGNTANFLHSLFVNVQRLSDNTYAWVDPSKGSCLQLKAIWGLSICLCVLFTLSAATTAFLWRSIKIVNAPRPGKDLE